MKLSKVRIGWRTDDLTEKAINYDLDNALLDILGHCSRCSQPFILDWGGGDGYFARRLMESSSKRVINLDPDEQSLKLNPGEISTVRGAGQRLPFGEGVFAGVQVRAALHHAPEDLSDCLPEIHRVLQLEGAVMFQEPLSTNPIASIARKLVWPDCYEPQERPFNPDYLLNEITRYFDIGRVRYYFLVSYLWPHLIARLPLKPLWRWFAALLLRVDKLVIRRVPIARRYSAYIEVLAFKR